MKRSYRGYTKESLADCLRDIENGMSKAAASRLYSIPLSTIKNKISKAHSKPVGRPKALSDEAEAIIANRATLLCDWGFPLDHIDIQVLVKSILDKQGVKNSPVLERISNIYPDNRPSRFIIGRTGVDITLADLWDVDWEDCNCLETPPRSPPSRHAGGTPPSG